MALVDDLLKGNPVAALGLGAAALAVPILFPSVRPQWAAAVKGGAKIFLEAEGGAEGDIIDNLAEKAIDQLADAMSRDTPEERKQASATVIANYKRRARTRADRFGRNGKDRDARFERHMARLRRKISHRHAKASRNEGAHWAHVEGLISEG